MNIVKYILALFVSCLFAGNVRAQDFTEEQKIIFERNVEEAVADFLTYLSEISDEQHSIQLKNKYVEKALSLFVANGEAYSYYDVEAESHNILNTGAKLYISSTSSGITKAQTVKNYLKKILHLRNIKIYIESADVVRIDNMLEVGDHYECIAYVYVKCYNFVENRSVCSYGSILKIRCFINQEDKSTYKVKLGDIFAAQTRNNFK